MKVDADDLAGPGDLAKEYGVWTGNITHWRKRSNFPEPVAVLSCGPIYSRAAVREWMKSYEPQRLPWLRFTVRKVGDHKWMVRDRVLKQWDSGPYVTRAIAKDHARKAEGYFANGGT